MRLSIKYAGASEILDHQFGMDLKPTVNHGMFTINWCRRSELVSGEPHPSYEITPTQQLTVLAKKTTWVPSRNFIYLWNMPKKLAWWFISLNMEVFHFERVNFNPHSITMSVGESPLYHLSLLYPTNYIPSKSIKISWKSLTIPSNSHIFMQDGAPQL